MQLCMGAMVAAGQANCVDTAARQISQAAAFGQVALIEGIWVQFPGIWVLFPDADVRKPGEFRQHQRNHRATICKGSPHCWSRERKKRKITPLGVITGASRPRGSPRLWSRVSIVNPGNKRYAFAPELSNSQTLVW